MANKNFNNNGFEFVDFELPSGTLWATKNVGADKATDYGLYFQWGDIEGYKANEVGKGKNFCWDDYEFWDGEKFTKYAKLGSKLDLEDDAANVNMGGDWHIPTPDQILELIDNTKIEWAKICGVSGTKFTSNKDSSKYIFIPTAGCAWGGALLNSESSGSIWSSVLSCYSIKYGKRIFLDPGRALIGSVERDLGLSIRGVIG